MSKKNILCIKQSLPRHPHYECEYLDIVTSLASFDHHIDLVFQGDGVFSLLAGEHETVYTKRLKALPLFDVRDVWVDEESLISRQLALANLSIPVKRSTTAMLKEFLQRSKEGIYLL